MADRLASAREAVRRAADAVDDAALREQLRSIDEGLREMTEDEGPIDVGPSTEGDVPRGDDLDEVEAKLGGLAAETGGAARGHVEDALAAIVAYRRASPRDR